MNPCRIVSNSEPFLSNKTVIGWKIELTDEPWNTSRDPLMTFRGGEGKEWTQMGGKRKKSTRETCEGRFGVLPLNSDRHSTPDAVLHGILGHINVCQPLDFKLSKETSNTMESQKTPKNKRVEMDLLRCTALETCIWPEEENKQTHPEQRHYWLKAYHYVQR